MKRVVLLLSLLAMLAVGSVAFAGAIPVYVSILPQKYFVERIGGDRVDVSVMVMPGASPATYEPSARQMVKLARAKAYFSIGVAFESAWLPRMADTNREISVVRTDAGITKRPIDGGDHGHGGHDDHDHGILDPHIWLSPELVKTIASNTCAGLAKIDPANKAFYQANLSSFLSEIEAVDADIRSAFGSLPKEKRSFMVFHPSWGYFAHDYGLRQIPIEVEGKSPSPRELAEIVEHGRELNIPVVFVQPQFSQKSAKVIAAEIEAQVVPLDPLAEDWPANFQRVVEALQGALR